MQKLTYPLFETCCPVFLGLLLFFASCQSETTPPHSSTAAPPEMERLLQAADTLSADALAAEVQKLPGTWADTFFHNRRLALALRQDGAGLNAAMTMYEKMRPGDEDAGAFIHLGRGIAHQFASRFDSADFHYKLAQGWYEKNGDKLKLRDALDCRASVCRIRGRFDETVAIQYQALELAEREIDRMYMKVKIAQTFLSKGDPDKALELLQEPARFYGQPLDTFMYAYTLAVQGNAFAEKKDFAKSLELHQKSLLLRQQIGKHAFAPENLHNMATAYNRMGNWQVALDTVAAAEKILAQLGNKQGIIFLQLAKGEALFHLSRLPEAEVSLLQCLENARTRKQYKVAWSAADLLSKLKKRQGQPTEALDFREQCMAFSDSLFSKEKEKIIQETATKYETREKQAQIASLQRENQLARERNFWIGGLSSVLLISGVWFARFRQRKMKEALEKDLAAANLKNELLLAQKQIQAQAIENQQKELENNRQQLTDFTAHLIEKNQQIEALQAQLGHPKKAGTAVADNAPDTNESDLNALFGQSLVTDSDWETFRRYFEKVFPGFLTRLKIQFPDLSTAELRLVLLTKMGLKSKEIADLIGISADSVYKVKYRFKKKMGVSEEELLDTVEE